MGMTDFSDHILAVAKKHSLPITNLQLQQIMYFTLRNSQSFLSNEQIEKIYTEQFKLVRYGIQIDSIYEEYYSCGSNNILLIYDNFNEVGEYKPLNGLIYKYLKTDVFRMVNASTSHKFWQIHKQFINSESKIYYNLNDVLRY